VVQKATTAMLFSFTNGFLSNFQQLFSTFFHASKNSFINQNERYVIISLEEVTKKINIEPYANMRERAIDLYPVTKAN